jgi:tetratricopeptide (TPR) repeat protein
VRATLLVLIVLAGQPGRAQMPPEAVTQRFTEAQQAYDAGEPERAVEALEAIASSGWMSPELWFNLGNAWFRAGDPARAILNYRRALWLRPGDPDLQANFRFTVERAGAAVPEPSWVSAWMRRVSPEGWKRLLLGAWWGGALALGLAWLWPRGQRVLRGLALVAVPVLGLAGWGVQAGETLATTAEAVVLTAQAEMRSAPTPSATALVRLPAGSLVEIVEEGGSWLRVRSDKETGWLPTAQLARVRP